MVKTTRTGPETTVNAIESRRKENLSSPVTDRFPDLSDFRTIVREDGTYLLGAGVLADGLIVPLFPDEQAAQEIVDSLSDDPSDLKMRISPLGDPFKAMRKAAGEGAAGFQFDRGLLSEERRESVFKQTAGRVLFPFMRRREEPGSQWPTVPGSALRCDAGVYLTRRGQTHFGPHELCQWVRWDVMDRASAKLVKQPLRSHDPGQSFWCLSHAPGDVHFKKAGERYAIEDPAIVLFASDTALRQFMPPEGFYPVFTSQEAAEEFLNQRLGGAFHIIGLGKSPYQNVVIQPDIMAQDLGHDGALIAKPVFLAGVGAEDENGPRGNIRHHNDLVAQCEYGFDKIKRVLAAHGANMNHVVKVTSYLTDMKNRVAYGQCLGRNFGTAPLPVHTLIGVASLAFPEMMVETDVTAITPD